VNVYFKMSDIACGNSKEAYNFYLYMQDWLKENIVSENWSFDNSYTFKINGVKIPCGIRINNFNDAYNFSRTCL
jgi:hypothetical protein